MTYCGIYFGDGLTGVLVFVLVFAGASLGGVCFVLNYLTSCFED